MALDAGDQYHAGGESTAVRLRELLKVKEEDELSRRTLAAAFTSDKPHRNSQVNQTLLEIFKEESTQNPPSTDTHHGRKGWRSFKECLRLRREGLGWTSSVPIPASDIPIPNAGAHLSRGRSGRHPAIENGPNYSTEDPQGPTLTARPTPTPSFARMGSTRMSRPAFNTDDPTTHFPDRGLSRDGSRPSARPERRISAEEDETLEDDDGFEGPAEEEEEEEPVRMSLMDLLQETDRQMGVTGMTYCGYGEEEEGEEEEVEENEIASSGKMEEHTCCVCMVRHRGAAFIPCGHTFCRLCSRELWVSRGNCPTCNGFILEILDIF